MKLLRNEDERKQRRFVFRIKFTVIVHVLSIVLIEENASSATKQETSQNKFIEELKNLIRSFITELTL